MHGTSRSLLHLPQETRLLTSAVTAPKRAVSVRDLGFLGMMAFCLLTGSPEAKGAADLYIKDTPADTGVEPNPDTGPMWVSEDIWVRKTPDPSYQPYPFPEAAPAWTPLPHENP